MKKFYCLYLFIYSFLWIPKNYSQSTILSFQNISAEEGLTEISYNTFKYRDSRGFLWISSIDGINRFDGVSIKQYKADNASGLMEDIIQSSFFEDEDGNLWFTTYQALYRYNRLQDNFSRFQLEKNNGEKIKEGYHAFFLEKQKKRLWVVAGGHLFFIDIINPENHKNTNIVTESVRFSVDTTNEGEIKRIYGSPWMNRKGIDIISLSPSKKWMIHKYLYSKINSPFLPPTALNSAIQNDSLVWFAATEGLILFNNLKPNLSQIFPLVDSNGQKYAIYNVAQYDSTQLIVSTSNQGLWTFNLSNKQFKKLDNYKSATPREIYLDKENYLWITDSKNGIKQGGSIKNNLQSFLKNTITTSLVEDRSGKLWVGTENKGVFILSKEGAVLKNYNNMDGTNIYSQVLHLSKGNRGKIGCVTSNGLNLFSPNSNIWKRVPNPNNLQFFYTNILQQSGKQLITTNKGIKEIIEEKGNYKLLSVKGLKKQGLDFLQIFQKENKDLLFTYKSKALWIYREIGDSLKNINKIEIGAQIFSFYENIKQDYCLLGTSNGLLKLKNDYTYEYLFSKKWELGAENIYGITEDKNGKIWLTSNRGLWCYDGSTADNLLHYNKEDGLPSENFTNYYGMLHSSNNLIWAGHNKGITAFNPSSISPDPFPPKIYIDELFVNNIAYKELKNKNIGEVSSLQLEYNQNSLSFKILAIGFNHAENNQIIYRLKGYDDNWISIKNGELAPFTKIPLGKYSLEIYAKNSNGVKSKVKTLPILISPHWTQTAWFKGLLIILVGMILFFFHILKVRNLERKKQVELNQKEAILNVQTQLAEDLHDDLGREISEIYSKSKELLIQSTTEFSKDLLLRINESANNSLESMEEMIGVWGKETDSLENLLNKISVNTRTFFASKDIECSIIQPSEVPEIMLDGIFRRNILRIIKESTFNVYKHAKANKIQINISIVNPNLIITIMDNGIGIIKKRKGGRGLNNIKKRAADICGTLEISSKPGKSTSITLIAPISTIKNP